MEKAIIGIAACVLFSALRLSAQERQVFKGEIIDRKTGIRYVLSNTENKTVYHLDDQETSGAFAGESVLVIGSLDQDTGTIHVTEMMRALSPKVMKAVLVYVDCYDCPREMAAAKKAGLREVGNWKRFYLAPDPHRADLIFLFSAAPYLGDYVTRDRPPARRVSVEVTYMNVIDPRTGERLWGDSRKWGSWFVGEATKDLIDQFRAQIDAQEGRVAQLLAFDEDQHREAPTNLGK
ncbi:MAG: hypothetical protein ABSA57_02095 [Candidatus Acidiferrales bacterium]|jgi:hypothetical protein